MSGRRAGDCEGDDTGQEMHDSSDNFEVLEGILYLEKDLEELK